MINNNFLRVAALTLVSTMACAKVEKIKHAEAPVFNECKANGIAEKQRVTGSTWLIEIDGKPVVTVAEFEKFIDDAAKSDAQLKMLIEQAREFVLPQLVEIKKQEVMINHWAEVNKAKDKAEYRKKLADGIKALEQMLNQEEFVQAFRKEPTEAEIVEYYNKNKMLDPIIVVQQPGIRARGVVFDNQEDAQKLLSATKDNVAAFTDEAKKTNKKVVDYGMVNEMSMVDPSIKEKLASLSKFPSVELIKTGDKEFVVVLAESKQEAKFKQLAEVKELVKQRIAGAKLQESIGSATEKLSSDYKIKVNKAYTEELNKKAEEKAAQQAQHVAAAQQNAQKQQPKAPSATVAA